MVTIGESISRVRNILKAVKEDPFLTDRFIYSLIIKFSKTLIKRESLVNSIYKYTNLFKEIPCIDLIEVDIVEACCTGIRTGCTIKRTKDKLPNLMEIDSGPVIRTVSSLDYSRTLTETYPSLYTNMTKTSGFKYNNKKYFWYLNGYLYIPNVEWEGVRISAIFDDDVDAYNCSTDLNDNPSCKAKQDEDLAIPEHLFSEIEQMVVQQILTAGQIPSDGADDSQNVMR